VGEPRTEDLRAVKRVFDTILAEIEEASATIPLPAVADSDWNRLSDLRNRQGPPAGYRRARVDLDGERTRIEHASKSFTHAVQTIVGEYRSGERDPGEVYPAVRRAFIRRSREAYLAGKRALGDLRPLTLEDEREIADVVEGEGLTPGMPVPAGSLGGLVRRVIESPALTSDEQEAVDRLDSALGEYTRQMTARVMRVAAQRHMVGASVRVKMSGLVVKQSEVAQGRIEAALTSLRRRILSGRLAPEGAVGLLAGALALEAIRAYRRARSAAGGGREPLSLIEQDELDQTQREVEAEVAAALQPQGLNWGRVLLLALVARSILGDGGVRGWLGRRLARTFGQFFRLAKAGEKAAFRDGTPSPDPDSTDTLPGAAAAVPVPGELERRVVVWWLLDPEEHPICIDCQRLADMSPYYLDTLAKEGIHPGSHHTRCRSNCRCVLEYELPIYV
jgi:hypothetical protein